MFLARRWIDGVPLHEPKGLSDGTLVPPLPRSGMSPAFRSHVHRVEATRYLFNYGPNFYDRIMPSTAGDRDFTPALAVTRTTRETARSTGFIPKTT
jgi:hypothetical protein